MAYTINKLDPFGNPPIPTVNKVEFQLVKIQLNDLIQTYETSRKVLTDLLDLESVASAKTPETLMAQLLLLAKVLKAENQLREQFISDLKKLGE